MNPQKVGIDELKKILSYISKGYKVPKVIYDTVFRIAKIEIEEKNRVIMLKRDPNIHRRNIQAAYVTVIEGETIDINPNTVDGYNADFDGDSCLANILVYFKNREDVLESKRINISDFNNFFECNLIDVKEKDDGRIVENYSVSSEVFVDAISLITGKIEKKRITNWSIHKNLKMYSISRKKKINLINSIRNCWVSDNHSLVCLDIKNEELKKVTPVEIIEDPSRFFLIKNNKKDKIEKNVTDILIESSFEEKEKSLLNRTRGNYSDGELGYFIGALLGDGDISRGGAHLTNSNLLLGNYWADCAEKILDKKMLRNKIDNNYKPHPYDLISKNGEPYLTAGLWGSAGIKRYFDINQFGNTSGDKRLPDWVTAASDEFAYGLFSGYIDTDGSVHYPRKMIAIQSKSRRLIEDFIWLLYWKFGCDASFYIEERNKKLGSYGKYVSLEEGETLEYYSLHLTINKSNKYFFENLLKYMHHNEKVKNLIKCIELSEKSSEAKHIKLLPGNLIHNDIIDGQQLSKIMVSKIIQKNYTQKEIFLSDDMIINSSLSYTLKNILLKQEHGEVEVIPCSLLDIFVDSSKTTGYDFTVEDFSTFTTDIGIFLFDTMALYVPVTKEAQDEAKDRLITTSGSSNLGSVNFLLKNEVFTGLFTLTSEDKKNTPKIIRSLEEADSLHPGDKVKVRFKGHDRITTAGRVIFNASLPVWFEFVDDEIDKGKVGNILSQIYKRDKGDYVQTIDKLMKLGFKIATKYPRTISMDMLNIPPNLMKLKENLAKEKDLMKQLDIVKEMESQLLIHLKKNEPHLYQIIGSGASKGHTQLRQLMIAKGLATDPEGNILPVIARAMNEGYTSEDYFNASGAGRKGVVSRVHFTAFGGYAYRKMIFVMSTLEANPMLRDCETKLTAKIKLTPDLFKRMKGRYVQNEPMGKIIPVTEDMIGEIINLRSPIFCKSMKLCRTCYGDLLDQVRTKSVGILAAMECTSLSEKIMKMFHTGGALELARPNITNMLSENISSNDEKIVKSVIYQDNISVLSREFVSFEINKLMYVNDYKIQETPDLLILPIGFFNMKIGEITISVTIEQELSFHLKNCEREENNQIINLMFGKDIPIFTLKIVNLEPADIARRLDSYVGGTSPWTTPESLFVKFYKLLEKTDKWDSVHLECIISNILRWNGNPHFPARVKYPYKPEMFSIKTLPGVMSYPLGLCYENFSKSIFTGMISERATESSIEKVLFGMPLSDIKLKRESIGRK